MNNILTLTSPVTESLTSPHTVADRIECMPVPDEKRAAFWPQHFGSIPLWITLEPRIFAWMDRFCADYSGGIWNFYSLSNGGAFMAPDADSDEKWSLFNSMNGNGGELSAEASGIAVCLMAYSHYGLQPSRLPDGMRCHDRALLPPARLRAASS